jgi:hypothetical protein
VNRDDEEDNQEADGQSSVNTIGEGGGPVINGVEFRPGDLGLVAGANVTAVLSTGQDGGEMFEQSFRNAAIQLHDLQEVGEDITDLRRFARDRGVADIGVSDSQFEVLNSEPEQSVEDFEQADPDEDETEDGTEDNSEDEEEDEDEDGGEEEPDEIENIEEDIDDIEEDE